MCWEAGAGSHCDIWLSACILGFVNVRARSGHLYLHSCTSRAFLAKGMHVAGGERVKLEESAHLFLHSI